MFTPEIQLIVDSCERINARYEYEYQKGSDVYELELYKKIIALKTRKMAFLLAKT